MKTLVVVFVYSLLMICRTQEQERNCLRNFVDNWNCRLNLMFRVDSFVNVIESYYVSLMRKTSIISLNV